MSLGILSGRFTMHGEGVRNVFSSRTEALRRITRSKKIYVATRQCANNERNQTHPHSPSFRHSFPSNSAKNQATINALERLPQRLYSNDALACRTTAETSYVFTAHMIHSIAESFRSPRGANQGVVFCHAHLILDL